MRRRHNDPWDQPWVTIAAVIGVIAVVVIAAFFFFGSGGSSGETPASVPSPTMSGSTSTPAPVSTTINPAAIKEQVTVSVPAEGIFVKVSYLGSFSGDYGMDGAMVSARDSGTRVYPVEYTNGAITATFKKTDSSTKPHELTVEIWKDGKTVKFEKTTAPHGEVSVSYTP